MRLLSLPQQSAWSRPCTLALSISISVFLIITLTMRYGSSFAAFELSQAQLQRLEQGEVLVGVHRAPGSSRGTVEATVLIEAPVELIWRVMNDCDDIPNFIPGVEECQVLDSGENWEIIRHEVRWVWLFPKISYVFKARYQVPEQISFSRIDGDLTEMWGSWRLQPGKNGQYCLVRYRVYLDPGFFIPQWLVRSALKADLPEILEALRRRVLQEDSG